MVLPTPPFWFATAIRIIARFPLPARRTPSATMICASGSVTLGSSRKSPCHEGSSASSSVSAFRPLGSSQTLFAVENPVPKCSNRSKGAKARALITSNRRGGTRSALPATISTAISSDSAARARNSALSRRASIRVTGPWCSAATISPGKPAPVPRSTQEASGAGANRSNWAESAMWRAQAGRGSRATPGSAVRSPRATSAAKASSRAIVSRGTSKFRSTQPRAPASSIRRPCAGRGRGSRRARPG